MGNKKTLNALYRVRRYTRLNCDDPINLADTIKSHTQKKYAWKIYISCAFIALEIYAIFSFNISSFAHFY